MTAKLRQCSAVVSSGNQLVFSTLPTKLRAGTSSRTFRSALPRELAVLDAMWSVRFGAEAPAAIRFVVLIVPLEPDDTAVAFEREDVRGDAIQEPAIVADDDGAAGVIEQRLFQRAQRVDVEVVGRLVEQEEVRSALQQLGKVHAIPFAARERADLALLLPPLEVEP